VFIESERRGEGEGRRKEWEKRGRNDTDPWEHTQKQT